jgi:hypothetical protein
MWGDERAGAEINSGCAIATVLDCLRVMHKLKEDSTPPPGPDGVVGGAGLGCWWTEKGGGHAVYVYGGGGSGGGAIDGI